MDKLKQLEQLELEQQDEITKHIKQLREESERCTNYYRVNNYGGWLECEYFNSYVEEWSTSQRNSFKTEEEAIQHFKNLKTKGELRELANDMNGDEGLDWNDNIPKYYIVYHTDTNKLDTSNVFSSKNLGQIYCIDPNFLDIALEQIGEDRLIDLIKSGV